MTEENLEKFQKRVAAAQAEVTELQEAIAELKGQEQKSSTLGSNKIFDYLKTEIEVSTSEADRKLKLQIAERALKFARERLVERQKELQKARQQIDKSKIEKLYQEKITKVIEAQKVYLKELREYEELASEHRATWMRAGGGEPYTRQGVRERDCFPLFIRKESDSANAWLLPEYEARKWVELD